MLYYGWSVDVFIQVLFHPLPPSTIACWPLKGLAVWWRHVCKDRSFYPSTTKQFTIITHTHTLRHRSLSPLHHLNVKAEAFVDWIGLSSDTWAQAEHFWCNVHHTVLRTQRSGTQHSKPQYCSKETDHCTYSYFLVCIKKTTFLKVVLCYVNGNSDKINDNLIEGNCCVKCKKLHSIVSVVILFIKA